MLTAAVLQAEGVSLLLVGSAALRLRGEVIPVRDADVVPEPGEANILRLHRALTGLAIRPAEVPAARRMSGLPVIRVPTSYGLLDCLLQRGREDWALLARRATVIDVAGVGLLVASAADAWALRRQFKEPASE